MLFMFVMISLPLLIGLVEAACQRHFLAELASDHIAGFGEGHALRHMEAVLAL